MTWSLPVLSLLQQWCVTPKSGSTLPCWRTFQSWRKQWQPEQSSPGPILLQCLLTNWSSAPSCVTYFASPYSEASLALTVTKHTSPTVAQAFPLPSATKLASVLNGFSVNRGLFPDIQAALVSESKPARTTCMPDKHWVTDTNSALPPLQSQATAEISETLSTVCTAFNLVPI